jgi:hypothetical protein
MRSREYYLKMRMDTLTGPKLVTAASRLSHNQSLPFDTAKTLVVGGLVRLWAFAFDHVRDDNTLDCTPDDVNHIVGIDKFTDVLPPEWFQIIDTNRVHLPKFLEDYGLDPITRRANRERKAKSRASHSQVTADSHVPIDQDIDIDRNLKKRKIPKEKKVPREAFDATTVAGLDATVWAQWIAYRTEIKKPIRPASLALAAKRLAAMGPGQRAAVEYSIASGYQGLFAPKPNGKHPPAAPNHSAEWAEAKHLAASIGFRAPWPQESVGAYTTGIKMEMTKAPRSIAQLASEVRQHLKGAQ